MPIVNGVEVDDSAFAELFPMWVGRVLITADSEKWAMAAAQAATGFGSSVIMSPAEAGIECAVPPSDTPDGRPGVLIQIYQRTRPMLKAQMISRIGQCVMTCPTTAAFDALPEAKRRLRVGHAIRMFGDGFEEKKEMYGRTMWVIPVMEGAFIIEDRFGAKKGIAGGNFIIMGSTKESALRAAEAAVEAIKKVGGVILPFPGGVCRSGSKVGSMKYKLPASTNHMFCPTLRERVPESQVPEQASAVYEIVFNAVSLDKIKEATKAGIEAATKVEGIIKISAVNFGGKLGPVKVYLRDLFT
ncbi:MAG: formylmethanofuran--tetrahydromethanopterin N-formyltransferase [Thermoproteota archaeon]|nr:MAG: formylmethanofuran--tetrahydromethanopterin N-formyltransferase [Candidatus Korarchaeota archaeon]RLG55530.1 MAG: formylmethanofuran--tetrahydromethanopterin N-formyltransferase [Candidatus Korarchaeota archaeon]